ncbi:plasmid mobilization protein [Microbispora bryophytorum]|uniref:Ribbon-helix-helix protein, CopG family n=1 Tax=Microbispora bryophytorum subsp. camponoti TaxID=1677852 RepID=A0ABR8L3A2_9ACTN|nr:ribbon-helix-helix protein, CopG family [Microbispora camponoti]
MRFTRYTRCRPRSGGTSHDRVHRPLASGRPSLTAPGRRSPQVTFRLSPEEKAAARALAEREGKTVSQLAREAFAQYLRDHAA